MSKKEKSFELELVDEFIATRNIKAELDPDFNAAAYIDTFNPTLTADGYKLEVTDYNKTSFCYFYPINSNPITIWNNATYRYSDDYHTIRFCHFKGVRDTLSRIPFNKLPYVISHIYVVFKAKDVFRYHSGAIQCHKSTLYGLNPEGDGLIELGRSCFGNSINEEDK